jgi:hypothetical protein
MVSGEIEVSRVSDQVRVVDPRKRWIVGRRSIGGEKIDMSVTLSRKRLELDVDSDVRRCLYKAL